MTLGIKGRLASGILVVVLLFLVCVAVVFNATGRISSSDKTLAEALDRAAQLEKV